MSDKSKPTVDEYIAGHHPRTQGTLRRLREIVHAAAPGAQEAIKWAQPVWSQGGPVAYAKVFKDHVNFGFWRGVELDDPKGLLEGTGGKMRHVKLDNADAIDAEALAAFVTQAVGLNQQKGDPTKGAAK